MPRNLAILCALGIAPLTALACTGDLGAIPVSEGPGEGDNEADRSMAGAPSKDDEKETPPNPEDDPSEETSSPHPLTRLARLTHAQYDNTTSDLLGQKITRSSEFLRDPEKGGFNNNVEALFVTGRLGRDYRRAAEDLALEAVENEATFEALLPCEPADDGCADDFIARLGLRMFRRPLTKTETGRYVELFAQGPDLVKSGDDFKDGARVTLEAMLQSPKFLYRIELSSEEDDDGAVVLSDFELATRLSYMLWNTTPDDELLAVAEEGELVEKEFDAQVARLLEDSRNERVVLDFHAQWLQLSRYDDLSKSPKLFPDFDASIGTDLKNETLEFVRYVTYEQNAGLETLLTAPYTMANSTIADFYGEEVSGSNFELLELDPKERAGLFTQTGFLASRAYPDASSPIHRGVFILHNVLCEDIPPPPGDVDFTLSEEALKAPTKREQVEIQTGVPGCSKCHSLINPIGFAFEHFDALGQFREKDGDEEVDASGTLKLASETLSFDGAVDLIQQVAQSDATRACYARHFLRYALARNSVPEDEKAVANLSKKLEDDDFTAVDLLSEVTKVRSFVARTQELQDR